jgi:hypothetical protein
MAEFALLLKFTLDGEDLNANFILLSSSFQMVSLLKLAKVTEEGVRFISPHDGTPMYVFFAGIFISYLRKI